MCQSSSAASRRACGVSRIMTTGQTRFAGRCSSTAWPTCSSMAWAKGRSSKSRRICIRACRSKPSRMSQGRASACRHSITSTITESCRRLTTCGATSMHLRPRSKRNISSRIRFAASGLPSRMASGASCRTRLPCRSRKRRWMKSTICHTCGRTIPSMRRWAACQPSRKCSSASFRSAAASAGAISARLSRTRDASSSAGAMHRSCVRRRF